MTIEEYSKKMGYVTVATQGEFELVEEIRGRISGEYSDDAFCAGLRAMFDNPAANEVWLMLDDVCRTCAYLNAVLGKKMRKNEELRKKNEELREEIRGYAEEKEELETVNRALVARVDALVARNALLQERLRTICGSQEEEDKG